MKKYWHLEAEDEESEGPTMMAGSSDDSRVSAEQNRIYFYSGIVISMLIVLRERHIFMLIIINLR